MKGGYLNDRGQHEKSPWFEIFEIFEIVEFLYDQILKQWWIIIWSEHDNNLGNFKNFKE